MQAQHKLTVLAQQNASKTIQRKLYGNKHRTNTTEIFMFYLILYHIDQLTDSVITLLAEKYQQKTIQQSIKSSVKSLRSCGSDFICTIPKGFLSMIFQKYTNSIKKTHNQTDFKMEIKYTKMSKY